MMRFFRQMYRYFKYYQYDDYMSDKWMQDYHSGYKKSVTSTSYYQD